MPCYLGSSSSTHGCVHSPLLDNSLAHLNGSKASKYHSEIKGVDDAMVLNHSTTVSCSLRKVPGHHLPVPLALGLSAQGPDGALSTYTPDTLLA